MIAAGPAPLFIHCNKTGAGQRAAWRRPTPVPGATGVHTGDRSVPSYNSGDRLLMRS